MEGQMHEKRVHLGGKYTILSDEEISQIHETSIKVLEEIGFETNYKPALELFHKNGALVDWEKQRVFLNRKLISYCIKQAPGEFVYYGRKKENNITVGSKRVHFGNGGLALYVLDLEGKKRASGIQDVADLARLADQLEYVDFFIVPVYAHDININALDINNFYHAMENTSKPVMGGVFSKKGLEDVINMSSVLAGGIEALQKEPFVGFICSITSPLKISRDQAELMMEVAGYGLPLATSTAPIAGATSPVTLAGTLVQQNSEALIGIVISQLSNPGTPVFYSAVPSTMDMRTGSYLMGSIESGIMNAAISQMAHNYRLPCYITVGATDSKVPDAQAAYESAATCMLAALAGGNFVHEAVGLLDGAMIASYAQYVIDNDIIGNSLRTLRGIEINRDTLSFDVIAKVGPGGNFMSQPHTVKYMRSESFFPRISNRQQYQAWLNGGSKDSQKKAEEVACEMLKNYYPRYIPEAEEKKIFKLYPDLVKL